MPCAARFLTHLPQLLHEGSSIETSMARNHHKRKSSRDSGRSQGSQQESEKILSARRDLQNFLGRNADQAFQGECAAQTKLSEAQSELDRREWKMQNADRALYDTGFQLQSQRMDLDQANQLTNQTQKEKSWLCDELDRRNKAFHADRSRSCQEIEDSLRICCAEAERARRFLPAACYTEGRVFEDLLAPDEPSPALFGNSTSMASASCGSVPMDTGRIAERAGVLERDPQNRAIPTPRFTGSSQSGILPLTQKELILKIVWLSCRGIKFQNCMSINSSSVGRRISGPKYALVQVILRPRCCGSQK